MRAASSRRAWSAWRRPSAPRSASRPVSRVRTQRPDCAEPPCAARAACFCSMRHPHLPGCLAAAPVDTLGEARASERAQLQAHCRSRADGGHSSRRRRPSIRRPWLSARRPRPQTPSWWATPTWRRWRSGCRRPRTAASRWSRSTWSRSARRASSTRRGTTWRRRTRRSATRGWPPARVRGAGAGCLLQS